MKLVVDCVQRCKHALSHSTYQQPLVGHAVGKRMTRRFVQRVIRKTSSNKFLRFRGCQRNHGWRSLVLVNFDTLYRRVQKSSCSGATGPTSTPLRPNHCRLRMGSKVPQRDVIYRGHLMIQLVLPYAEWKSADFGVTPVWQRRPASVFSHSVLPATLPPRYALARGLSCVRLP